MLENDQEGSPWQGDIESGEGSDGAEQVANWGSSTPGRARALRPAWQMKGTSRWVMEYGAGE